MITEYVSKDYFCLAFLKLLLLLHQLTKSQHLIPVSLMIRWVAPLVAS